MAHSSLFDETALAEVLSTGRMAAAWFDSLEPGALDPGGPLHDIDTLQVTPRVASTTRESRIAQRLGGGAAHRRAAVGARRQRSEFRPTAARRAA